MPDDRRQYVAAHGLLRLALSDATGVPAEQWRFQAGENGRPEIAAPLEAADIRFSLSHTRELVACAVGVAVQVGLAVERIEDGPAIHEAGELFLAEPERRDCQALPLPDRTRRLYEYWTLKEAFAKALGLGLALAPESAAFELDGRGGARVRGDAPAAGEGWQFSLWAPTPRHCLATAVRGQAGPDVAVISRRREVFA